ncbi:MAG: site-specific DNA-methyltransferase, partial [Saprospiraceae bacterium]|nr:site-specific DNA-methyltransferase [Saprospiraceae bacterium]
MKITEFGERLNLSWPNGNTFGPTYDVLHPILKTPVKVPDRGWRWKKETFDSLLDYENIKELHDGTYVCGKIWFDKDDKTQPSLVKYLDEVDTLLLRSILSLKSDGGIEVENLFEGKSYFAYPKPTSLIKMLVQSFDLQDGDCVLDFFSGSATVADAVIQLNKVDGINRKFMCIQLPEKTDEKTEAFKAGYSTISDIAIERMKKVIQKVEAEKNGKLNFNPAEKQDLGFKVFALSDSNFKLWRQKGINSVEELEKQMDLFTDPVSKEAQIENMVYELLIKSGFDLNCQIEKKNEAFYINSNEMVLLLESVSEDIVKDVIESQAKKVIALDKLFEKKDQLKTNTSLQ